MPFFSLFLVPYWGEEPATKIKTPFSFLFLTSLLERPNSKKEMSCQKEKALNGAVRGLLIIVKNLLAVFLRRTASLQRDFEEKCPRKSGQTRR